MISLDQNLIPMRSWASIAVLRESLISCAVQVFCYQPPHIRSFKFSAMSGATTIPDMNDTLGALEIGVLISVFLFGFVTLQSYLYFSKFPNDKWGLKVLVRVGI